MRTSKPQADSPVYVERDCVFNFQGRSFEAGGAVVTPDYLIAYPDKDGVLKDWHGKAIGTWRTISARRAIFFGRYSWQGSHFYYMRAKVNGREYSLRGFGEGMIAKGKAVK